MATYKSKKAYMYGTGRRKSSVARVHLFPGGTGSITINGRDIDDYFGLETLKLIVRQPLVTTELLGKVDIVATVTGGGVTGQAGAIRHGIARALLKSPKVLILDDSTSAVDTATDAKIRAAFAKSIPGTTKIIIAQRISSVENADRILIMDNGRIDAFDTHENLLKSNAIYQEIYESQVKGGGDFDQSA